MKCEKYDHKLLEKKWQDHLIARTEYDAFA